MLPKFIVMIHHKNPLDWVKTDKTNPADSARVFDQQLRDL